MRSRRPRGTPVSPLYFLLVLVSLVSIGALILGAIGVGRNSHSEFNADRLTTEEIVLGGKSVNCVICETPLDEETLYNTQKDPSELTNCTALTQSSFASGTYVITESNSCYYLAEDVSFDPPSGTILADRPLLGWSSMITIAAADNVTIHLNGYEMSISPAFEDRLRSFAESPLASSVMGPGDIDSIADFNPDYQWNPFVVFIQLGNCPFQIPFLCQLGGEPSGIRPPPTFFELVNPNNVVIEGGRMRANNHIGVFGNANTNVTIRDLKITDMGISAITLGAAENVLIERVTTEGLTASGQQSVNFNPVKSQIGGVVLFGILRLDPTFGPVFNAGQPPERVVPRAGPVGGQLLTAEVQQLIYDLAMISLAEPEFPIQSGLLPLLPYEVSDMYNLGNTYGINVRPILGPRFGSSQTLDCAVEGRFANITLRDNRVSNIFARPLQVPMIFARSITRPQTPILSGSPPIAVRWTQFFPFSNDTFVEDELAIASYLFSFDLGIGQPIPAEFIENLTPTGARNKTVFRTYAEPGLGFNTDGSQNIGINAINLQCLDEVLVEGNLVKRIVNDAEGPVLLEEIGGTDIYTDIESIYEGENVRGMYLFDLKNATVRCNTVESIFTRRPTAPNGGKVYSAQVVESGGVGSGNITITNNNFSA